MVASGEITSLLEIKPESDPNPFTDPNGSLNMRDPNFISLKNYSKFETTGKITS